MKSKGVGDTIAKFTKNIGIKKIVDKVSDNLNTSCGCGNRQRALNKAFPYKIKETDE